MGTKTKWEYFRAIYQRYRKASLSVKTQILEEFCHVCGYNRKYVIAKLNGPAPQLKPPAKRQHRRSPTYSSQALAILQAVWEASGYPWSVRLKALLPLWLPWVKKHYSLTPKIEQQLLSISARQIDRRLKPRKTQLKRRLYGRTKPGTLLKHHIPIKTDSWNVKTPGFTEIDLVSHSGNSEKGEFIYSLNVTDIYSTWVETRAVMGKGQYGVKTAMQDIEQQLPFKLLGIDSDNGSEFINYHLKAFCDERKIQFTRGRPYKKDDNAHIEQKNWTHVRKILGYLRYDSPSALEAIHDLYRKELRWMMNLFQPSVKLVEKSRVGSKLKKTYDPPTTPLDRLLGCKLADPALLQELKKLRASLDPFKLSQTIEQKLDHIFALANSRYSLRALPPAIQKDDLSPIEKQTFRTLSNTLGISVYIGKHKLPKG
jgi:transposase InsO family protein